LVFTQNQAVARLFLLCKTGILVHHTKGRQHNCRNGRHSWLATRPLRERILAIPMDARGLRVDIGLPQSITGTRAASVLYTELCVWSSEYTVRASSSSSGCTSIQFCSPPPARSCTDPAALSLLCLGLSSRPD